MFQCGKLLSDLGYFACAHGHFLVALHLLVVSWFCICTETQYPMSCYNSFALHFGHRSSCFDHSNSLLSYCVFYAALL